MGAAAGGALGGDHLGDHAALADRGTGAAGHGFERLVAGDGFGDQRGPGVLARIGRVQAGLVGQDDQGLGFDQVGDQGAQGVVVAELDFVGDDRVVLVDDRNDAELEQGGERRSGVQIALAVGQVVVGQQDLRGVQPMLGKGAFIDLRQSHLADGCSCLQFVDQFRPLGPAQALHAAGDGAGRDEDDLLALLANGADLARPVVNRREVEAGAVVGDKGGADLDDQPLGVGEARQAHASSPSASLSSSSSGISGRAICSSASCRA